MTTCVTDVCGTGDWDGPKPGDPSTNSVLNAVPTWGGIRVTWSWPSINPHAVAHVQLYRNSVNDLSTAVQLAIVAGNHYVDPLETAQTKYYWIKIVSVNGTVSEFIGPAWATSIDTAEGMIEYLTGQIDRGVLAMALKAELDQISLLNADLLDEIMARENASISLAQAIEDAQAGVADALTFIANVNNSRVSDNEVIVEQINLVAATLNDSYGAVVEAMSVDIDGINGTIDTLYTVRLTANGLAGGFGIHNNSSVVEAGFDVDTFWVGRTQANKRKPFIISGGVVYLDTAVIADATITTAKIANAAITTAKIGDAQITNAKIGNASISNAKIIDGEITTAKIGHAQIDTLRVAGNAITVPVGASLMANHGSYSPAITLGIVTDGSPMWVCANVQIVQSGVAGIVNPYIKINGAIVGGVSVIVYYGNDPFTGSGTGACFIPSTPVGYTTIQLDGVPGMQAGSNLFAIMTKR